MKKAYLSLIVGVFFVIVAILGYVSHLLYLQAIAGLQAWEVTDSGGDISSYIYIPSSIIGVFLISIGFVFLRKSKKKQN